MENINNILPSPNIVEKRVFMNIFCIGCGQDSGKSHALDGCMTMLDEPVDACTCLYIVVLPAVLILLYDRTLDF